MIDNITGMVVQCLSMLSCKNYVKITSYSNDELRRCSLDIKDLETAHNKKIGIKQSSKTITSGKAKALYIAKDAEQHVIRSIVKLAEEKEVEIIYVDSMLELGRACDIDVGAATAVIVE